MSVDLLSLRQYPTADASVANAAMPPASIVPEAITQALPTQFKKMVIKPLGSNTVQQGQPLEFQLPFANGELLKAGSAYITADLNITTSTATTFGFKGPAGTSQRLFQRLTVSYGGQQIDDLNFYNQWCTEVVSPFLSSSQNENLQSNLFGLVAGAPNHLPFTQATGAASNLLSLNPNQNYSAANGTVVRVVIPVMSSFLLGGSSSNDIPLFACSSPISIRFLTDVTSNIFYVPSGDITSWSLSDISLVYTAIRPDAGYISTLIAGMNAGKVFPISCNTFNAFKPALSSSTSVLQTVNARSVNGIFISYNPATENGTITKSGFCKCPTGASSSNVGTLRVYADNDLINMYPDGMLHAEDRLAELVTTVYGNITDSDISLPFTAMGGQAYNGGYLGQYYINAISCQAYNDLGCVKRGIPMSQLRVELTYANAQAGDTLTIYTLYEKLVFFGAMGSVQVVQ
jgi:hypothetical protein